jgi:hypothetical protein
MRVAFRRLPVPGHRYGAEALGYAVHHLRHEEHSEMARRNVQDLF